jgi:hypothetical protein
MQPQEGREGLTVPVTCIFCSAPSTSREHALPEWIANRFGLRGGYLEERVSLGLVPNKQKPSIASYRRKMVCECCQRHFMLLENQVCDLLDSMGHGEQENCIAAETQLVLARWAAKTAYAILGFNRVVERTPRSHRVYLRQTGTPVGNVYVGIGRQPEMDVRVVIRGAHLGGSGRSEQPTSYDVVFSFGVILFKVFSVYPPDTHDAFAIHEKGLVHIWPPSNRPLVWPTKPALSADAASSWVPLA